MVFWTVVIRLENKVYIPTLTFLTHFILYQGHVGTEYPSFYGEHIIKLLIFADCRGSAG